MLIRFSVAFIFRHYYLECLWLRNLQNINRTLNAWVNIEWFWQDYSYALCFFCIPDQLGHSYCHLCQQTHTHILTAVVVSERQAAYACYILSISQATRNSVARWGVRHEYWGKNVPVRRRQWIIHVISKKGYEASQVIKKILYLLHSELNWADGKWKWSKNTISQ